MVIKNPRMSFEKSRRSCDLRHSGQNRPLASDHHGLLIIPIHWLASSLCLLSSSKLVRSDAIWLPLHHPGGCCTLVVDEEIPPDNVERFKCLEKAEKHNINVIYYYYYYYHLWNSSRKLMKCYASRMENDIEDRIQILSALSHLIK